MFRSGRATWRRAAGSRCRRFCGDVVVVVVVGEQVGPWDDGRYGDSCGTAIGRQQ